MGPAWNLTSEYSDVNDELISTDLDSLTGIFDKVEKLNESLSADNVDTAQQVYKLSIQASTLLSNVSTFASCLLSVDSQDEPAQHLNGKLQSHRKRFGDLFKPLSQFQDSADAEVIDNYLSDPEVAPSAFLVRHGRECRHENLTLDEESLVNGLSQDGIHAWGDLYDQLSGSLKCEVLVDNEVQQIGIAEASGHMMSSQDKQRQDAWTGINTAWQVHEEACAASINAIAGWRLEMCQQRSREKNVHFLDAPVHMNRISRETLDTLLGVAETFKPLAQRAAKLQARAYGKDRFGPWDLRAPAPQLTPASEEPIPFETAVDIIASAYGQVDQDMEDFVRMMVANHWVEGTVGPNKRPGAYCTGFQKTRTPRVYMTYTGGQSDVITLAHELGHALHSWVMRDLPQSQTSYGMSLAETASTFGETLVRDALLARSDSPQERLDIMWEEMSALTAFMLNIPTRFEFEKNLYEARADRPLRPAELKDMMSSAWRTWYGDALAEPDPLFWASKLHFYISGLSFYNFPYLFGYLFSLGVYAKRQSMGDKFYGRYIDLLRDTGRMTAEEIARKHLDVNLIEPAFWQETVKSLEGRVNAFEKLLDEVLA
ncbi:MAG: M3 family oligoendopeptidase [bacterium]